MGIHSLGYVRVETPRFDEWRRFATDLLGLMPVESGDSDLQAYRIDDHPQRVQVRRADAPGLGALGFEVIDGRDLDAVVSAVADFGVEVTEGSSDEIEQRRVTGLAKFTDPGGIPVELFYGPVRDHVPVQTPLVSGFVTGNGGMGHAVVIVEDARRQVDLYRDVLGFHERNTMVIPGGFDMWFLSPNSRHHSLAIIEMPGEVRLAHFMVEARELDDVGRALDRVIEADWPIQMTLGRHTNDHMVSFYAHTPDGSAVEFGWGGQVIDEPETTYQITKPSFWGHHLNEGFNPESDL